MDARLPPIAELVPHHGPALLIDAVLAAGVHDVRVAAHITAAHPYFVPGRGVPAWVGIEMMAQAIAALAGLEAHRTHRARGSGMLLGTRRYRAQRSYFAENALLEISAQREYSDLSGIAACECAIHSRAELLAEATIIVMKIGTEPQA